MTNTTTSPDSQTKQSKLEGIKANSNFLREPVATELQEDSDHFSKDGVQILKFHGSYQQDNRDNRQKGQGKDYQFMLRTRSPGGIMPAQLYLTLDRLSSQYANNTLRVTTRQGFQLHGILKKNLKTVISDIVRNLGSTLGACGDLNRNVMAPPAPYKNRPEYQYAWEYANNIADLLSPQTGAYYEIWLDGEKAISSEAAPEVKAARERDGNGTIFHSGEEPIYGTQYMPRKFKCAVTVPGDNAVDIYTQDVGFVTIMDENQQLQGFNVIVGGGMGRTHNKEDTFARMGDPLGYVAKEDVYDLMKAIVATQRDYGERYQRRNARMKYLLYEWGVEKFRQKVEAYFGKSLEPFKPLPEFRYEDYLGWHEQGDGKLFVGVSIENGRIQDTDSLQLKTALRKIVEKFQIPLRLTPNHNVILYEIAPEYRDEIQSILSSHGVQSHEEIDPLVRYSMACPALPTCGLAITESERQLPGFLGRIRTLLNRMGLQDEQFTIRMTGCPNGCSRPYMAELAFVGSMPGAYQVWLGGSFDQTRLAEPICDRMRNEELEQFLEPIFAYFKRERKPGENFGDFCHRVGFDAIQQFRETYELGSEDASTSLSTGASASVDGSNLESVDAGSNGNGRSRSRKTRHRINIRNDIYPQLKAEASRRGQPMSELVYEALKAYLGSEQRQ
ncbi:sulfite reductase, ferredoxin dependent [Geitlerinema sp. PCC 9228]|uniref:sulfite reductase, ferredoxin dependent n=1 Tax=Geitlerinema sp. PCC 9228 TaxID=111611 RepID=UPI0008F9A7BB|nr:sulfite reductase, ferredoxin dependent [Geitlerinema sp. PCC 9228]